MKTDCVRIALIAVIAAAWLPSACGTAGGTYDTPPKRVRETIDMPLQESAGRVRALKQVEVGRLEQRSVIPTQKRNHDVFKQQEIQPPRIDILIVIDNSGSMEEEQLNLSGRLEALLSDLSEVDWQINVITTDSVCQPSPKLPLKPDTEDMRNLFVEAIRAGTYGLGNEMALEMARRHLSGECRQYPTWIRPDTDLAVLVVSDEDEDEGSDYADNAPLFVEAMSGLGYDAAVNFKVYGIIGHPSRPCETAYALAPTYAAAIDLTEGLWGSICDADYSPTLNAISRDIRVTRKIEFPLSKKPVLTSIELELDTRVYDADWALVGQKVVLANALPDKSTLVISYQIESARLIDLGVPAAAYALDSVAVNGEPIAATDFQYDAVKNTVLLAFDPKDGDVIETTLLAHGTLLTRFPFPEPGAAGVRCYVDRLPVASRYEGATHEMVVEPAIPAGKTAYCLF